MDDEDRTLPGPPPPRKIAEASTLAMDTRPPIADDVTALGPLEPLDRAVGAPAVPGFVTHAAYADARTDLELERPPSIRPASSPLATPDTPVDMNPIPPAVTATLRPGEQLAMSPIAPDVTAPMHKLPPSTPAPAPAPRGARALTIMLLVAAIALVVGLGLRLS